MVDLIVGDIVCTLLLVVVLILTLAFLLVPKLVQYRKEGKRNQAMAMAVISVLVMVLGVYGGAVYSEYYDWSHRTELEYVLTIVTEGEGTLYVPVSNNRELEGSLYFEEGNGSLSVQRWSHGLALKVEYAGNTTVRGRIVTVEDPGDWELTMLEEIWFTVRRIHWYGLELDEGNPPMVELRFERHTYNEDDWFEADWTPQEGWGTFSVRWQHMGREF
jgi:hypothetical protein